MFYRAHGLLIASDRPIPELLECAGRGAPDLTLHFQAPPNDSRDLGSAAPWFESPHRTADGRPELVATRRDGGRWLEFAYPDGTRFVIDGAGTAIFADGPAELPFQGLCEYLLGPMLGIVLRLRGLVCLHASAVDLGGRAVAFAGPAGAGKSTMAAAFARSGYQVLSDDTIALVRRRPDWLVSPAYPRIRLWPESVEALAIGRDVVVVPDAADGGSRFQFDLASNGLFAGNPVPLTAIYLIEFAEAAGPLRVEAVAPAEGLPLLSANTFAHRVLDRAGRVGEFEALADLVAAVPLRRLVRSRDLADLPRVRDAVVADAVAGVG